MPRSRFFLLFTLFCTSFLVYLSPFLFSKTKAPEIQGTFQQKENKWSSIPDLQLYTRITSKGRFIAEFNVWFLKTFRLFWPHQLSDVIVVVFDAESKSDQTAANVLSNTWPYPKVCFREPDDKATYHSLQRWRMFWDYFYPDSCITAEYVGFVDTDTVFTSVVTPGSLFHNGKPIVLPRIGEYFIECWANTTQYLLGFKEAIQCMSYFPLIFKVEHIVEMREFIANRFEKPFDEVFSEVIKKMNGCMCQFSIMCNYIWYKHRDEYQFHMSLQPNDKWDGKNNWRKTMVSFEYLKKELLPNYSVPKPRIATHGAYAFPFAHGSRQINKWRRIDMQSPEGVELLNSIITKGLCFGGGFDICPQNCKHLDRHALFEDLFAFEWIDWLWDHRCLKQQKIYLQEVKELVSYNQAHNIRTFGVSKIEDICSQF